jgi:hypothetical protein
MTALRFKREGERECQGRLLMRKAGGRTIVCLCDTAILPNRGLARPREANTWIRLRSRVNYIKDSNIKPVTLYFGRDRG